MKIYKKKDLAFSIVPYGAAGNTYLGLAAMAFFDLTAPTALLTEQDMWKAVPEALGPGGILDPGMPKLRGEVLAAGSACAPRDTMTRGLRTRVQVGDVDKSLAVFGDRFWLPDGTISEPRPFATMPVTYDKAYGGPDFPQNPTGKGMTAVAVSDDRSAVPLPNIEDPSRLLAAEDDRPAGPAGFGPQDITWPQRARYNGTYDERWKAQRWPGLPDDTDFLLFNRAPSDQWAREFFRGDEPFVIENMHPDMARITGSLPGLRARMFVTLLAGYKLFADPATFKETFIEVPTHLETVWLFPTILRGVALYRGSIANADDEARDVARVYLEWERPGEPAATIEEYAERQRKAMDRSVPVNMAPFQAAGKKMAQAVKMVKNAPKAMARIKDSVAGKTPVMPMGPADMEALADNAAAQAMGTVDKLEAVARDLHARFGHLAEIDLGRFDGLRQTVDATRAKAKATAQTVGKAMDKAASVKADMLAKAKAHMAGAPNGARLAEGDIDIEALRRHGYDPDFQFPEDKGKGIPFHDAGFPFVVACRRALERDAPTRDALRRLGLPDSVVKRAWLGLNTEEQTSDGVLWGHPAKPDGTPPPAVTLPAGLVFPRFDGAILNRLCIRPGAVRGELTTPGADILIQGSDATPLALPPAEEGGYFVRVSDELQALFMEEEIGDACGVVALADPGEKPDADTAKAVAAMDAFAVVLPEGTALTSALWTAWKAVYANAVPVILPKGQTVFDARAAGCDIRALVMEALPPRFAARHAIEPALPEKGAPAASPYPPIRFPDLGIKKAVDDAMAAAQQKAAPLRAKAAAIRQKADEDLAAMATKYGKNVDELKALGAAEAKRSPAEDGAEAIAKLMDEKTQLRRVGALTPEIESKINEAITRTQGIVAKAQSRYEAGAARLKAAGETIAKAKAQIAARIIPGMTREEMDAAGLDPDKLRPMTREEVIERYGRGLSFARRNLTGTDLSGLDLTGIDLSEAIVKSTRFVGTTLDKARLCKAIAPKADFTKASMRDTDLHMALLMEAKLRKARLSGANFKQTLLRKADLEKADLSGATMRLALVTDARLKKAVLADADISLSTIDRCDLTKTDFRGARLQKTLIRDLTMDRTDFSGASLHSVQLSGITGRKVVFTGADMTKFRIGNQCKLGGTDFQNALLKQACLRESDLSGSDFRGAVLDGAMVELCDAKGVVANRISAKKCSIIKTDLAGADLYGINLFLGSLRKSRLTGANLGRSNLYGVDFYKCVVGETNFDGANLKRTFLESKADLLR